MLYASDSYEKTIIEKQKKCTSISQDSISGFESTDLNPVNDTIRIAMAERAYSIDILCTGYCLESLQERRKQLLFNYVSTTPENTHTVLYAATIDMLNEAISRYGEKRYQEIRAIYEKDMQ